MNRTLCISIVLGLSVVLAALILSWSGADDAEAWVVMMTPLAMWPALVERKRCGCGLARLLSRARRG